MSNLTFLGYCPRALMSRGIFSKFQIDFDPTFPLSWWSGDRDWSELEAMTEGPSRSRSVSLGKSPHIFDRLLDESVGASRSGHCRESTTRARPDARRHPWASFRTMNLGKIPMMGRQTMERTRKAIVGENDHLTRVGKHDNTPSLLAGHS